MSAHCISHISQKMGPSVAKVLTISVIVCSESKLTVAAYPGTDGDHPTPTDLRSRSCVTSVNTYLQNETRASFRSLEPDTNENEIVGPVTDEAALLVICGE
jgi:hypothetical protein